MCVSVSVTDHAAGLMFKFFKRDTVCKINAIYILHSTVINV